MIYFSIPFKSDKTTYHRDELLTKCLMQLDSLEDQRFAVYIAYWGSDIFDWNIISKVRYSINVIDCKHFCSFSSWEARKLIAKYVLDEEIFHSIDADIFIKEGYIEHVYQNVSEGVMYSPICYSLNEEKPIKIKGDKIFSNDTNGWWRSTAYGLFGILKKDWNRLNLDNYVQRSWGKDDEERVKRVQRTGIKIIREKCDKIFHLWHPNELEYKNRPYVEN